MNINNVGVVGCGLMGAGIVETCARAGYAVTVREINAELLQHGLHHVEKSMSKAVSRGKLTQEDMDAALARIEAPPLSVDEVPCEYAYVFRIKHVK